MKNKSVVEEADDVRRAVEMVQLGARMQMLEVETRLSLAAAGLEGERLLDLVSGGKVVTSAGEALLRLRPYQVLWLKVAG